PAVFLREHALEIQLPWLQALAPEAALVPVLVGRLEAGDGETLAAALRSWLAPDTLVVVSSDLVHYGRRFDYLPVPPTDRAAIAEVLATQAFVLGPHVERFEAAMAAYCGVPHAIGVGSGTDALLLVLGALGVGPGVAVLTTPFSFWATASTIVRLGATPLFADVD